MKTDFATNGGGLGAWIEVREFSLGHIYHFCANESLKQMKIL